MTNHQDRIVRHVHIKFAALASLSESHTQAQGLNFLLLLYFSMLQVCNNLVSYKLIIYNAESILVP